VIDASGRSAIVLSRRQALRTGVVAACATLLGGTAGASHPSRRLDLYSVNTGESCTVEYMVRGRYYRDALLEVNQLMRDHRSGDIHPIDPTLLDLLHDLRRVLGSKQPAHIVCGYRSPTTNARKLAAGRRVARNSYHLRGQAVDVFFPDRKVRDLRRAALRFGTGGVGHYPRAGFVHLDTGPVRSW